MVLHNHSERLLRSWGLLCETDLSSDHNIVLADALLELKRRLKLPLRFWIPHCDATPGSYNHERLMGLVDGLGLTVRRSRERWAHALAS